MEDLEAALALNLSVSSEQNCPSSIHPRFNNYKNKAKLVDNQEERRKRVVESSKALVYFKLIFSSIRITCSQSSNELCFNLLSFNNN